MPKKYAQALELSEEGKTQEEIADEMGSTQTTVGRWVKKAKAYKEHSETDRS